MALAQPRRDPFTTAAEFLRWPDDGNPKAELIDGLVVAMAPASLTHGLIQARLARLIGNSLEASGSRCVVATEPGIVPRLRASSNVRIPDLGVTCTSLSASDVAMPDPVLLVEIISPGNAAATWDNVWTYASIPSLREILVVHTLRTSVELLRRDAEGAWPPETVEIGPDGTLVLETVGLACPVADLYGGTAVD